MLTLNYFSELRQTIERTKKELWGEDNQTLDYKVSILNIVRKDLQTTLIILKRNK